MNDQLFNPFEHKLHNGFIPREGDLYQHEKQKQLEILSKISSYFREKGRRYDEQ